MEETSLVISAQRHLHVSAGPRLMGLPLKSWEAVSFPSRGSAPLSAAQRPVLTTNKSAVRSNFSAAGRELARIGWFGEPDGCRGEEERVTVPAPQQETPETTFLCQLTNILLGGGGGVWIFTTKLQIGFNVTWQDRHHLNQQVLLLM